MLQLSNRNLRESTMIRNQEDSMNHLKLKRVAFKMELETFQAIPDTTMKEGQQPLFDIR